MKVLVVAAWDPELVRFRALMAERPRSGDPAALVTASVGVGIVEAAVGTARVLAAEAPDAAWFVGTCGAFAGRGGAAAAPGDVVAPRDARLVAPEVSGGRAALPAPMPVFTRAAAALHDAAAAAGARPVAVACTVAITTDDALADLLGANAEVEHLELFAFGRACDAAGVPWGAVLGVANAVGARGRAEWAAHHEAASAEAAELAFRAIARADATRG